MEANIDITPDGAVLAQAPQDPCCNTLLPRTGSDIAAFPKPPRGLNHKALQRAVEFIDRHLSDSIGLADIANAACISRFHFARLFRVSTGRSPMEYVLDKRIALAKELLAHRRQKISVTAATLGFFDQSHFTRTFRRATGLSPREFSRLHAPPRNPCRCASGGGEP